MRGGRKADERAPRNQYKAKENTTRHYASAPYIFHLRQRVSHALHVLANV